MKYFKALLSILLLVSCTGHQAAYAQTQVYGEYDATPPTIADGNRSAIQTDSKGNLTNVGNVAAATTDSGNPVKVGGVYNSTTPTYTTGQRSDIQTDSRGAIRVSLMRPDNTQYIGTTSALADGSSNSVVTYAINAYGMAYNGTTWDRVRGDNNGIIVQPGASSTYWYYAPPSGGLSNTTSALTLKTAAGASVRNYVTGLQCSHDSLGGPVELLVRDGASGTVMWRGRLGSAAGEAVNAQFNPPLKGTANTLTEWAMAAAVTGVVYCNFQGYTGF